MKCYLCRSENLKVVRTKLRHDISRNVLECQDCGLNFLEPKNKDLKEYYQQDYRQLYTPVIGKKLSSKETFEMYLPQQQIHLDQLKDILKPEMKVLDVGCSSGHFLYSIKDKVKEVTGIEFNKDDAEFVNKELGIKVYSQPIAETDLPQQHFDLITAFQVLEHVQDPINFLVDLKKYLKPDGYICLEVPNVCDALLYLYQIEPYAAFWFREPHLFNFSPKTLGLVLEKAGFKGKMQTVQRYNFVNHLNWVLTGQPQKSADVGMGQSNLKLADNVNKDIKEELQAWLGKVDQEYKDLLNKHQLGDSILFIGQKNK
ncbi:MAG: class I SAM-dependent methyltransferase [Patescibacteria group bacterium]